MNPKDKLPQQQQREKCSQGRDLLPGRSVLILITILITVALASIGVFAFLIRGQQIRPMLDTEVFNLTYQFLLIVVIGGAVSLLYTQFSDERDRAQEHRVLLRQMHSELLSAFNAAKRVRRTLRARVGCASGVSAMCVVNAAEYEEQIDLLMEAQFTFEVYAKRASDPQLFFGRGEELGTELGTVEDYLNDIIDEYEDRLKSFEGTPPIKPLAKLPKLAEFIGPYKDAHSFQQKFKYPFRRALLALPKARLM
jgi:hypothetical protein